MNSTGWSEKFQQCVDDGRSKNIANALQPESKNG